MTKVQEARKTIDSATLAYQGAVEMVQKNSENREQAYGDAGTKLEKLIKRLDRRISETNGKANEVLADAKSQVVEIATKNAMEHGNVPRSVLEAMMQKELA